MIDETWVPCWSSTKYEPCPWKPDYIDRRWVRPLGAMDVRIPFESGLCPHDCEALLCIARSEHADDVRMDGADIVVSAGSDVEAWLRRREAHARQHG